MNDRPMNDSVKPYPPDASRPSRPSKPAGMRGPRGNLILLYAACALGFTGGIADILHYRLVGFCVGLPGTLIAVTGLVRSLRWSRRAH